MRFLLPLALLCLLPATVRAQLVAEMTPQQIERAIAEGASAKKAEPYKIGNFALTAGTFTTPYQRVVLAAFEAKKAYKPFTAADVTPDLVAPEIRVRALPFTFKDGVASVVAVVVTKRGTRDATQPISSAPFDMEFSNAFGKTIAGKGIEASFPLSLVDAANEIRIVMDSGAREQTEKFEPAKLR
jgi:hypothetical protein